MIHFGSRLAEPFIVLPLIHRVHQIESGEVIIVLLWHSNPPSQHLPLPTPSLCHSPPLADVALLSVITSASDYRSHVYIRVVNQHHRIVC